MIKLEQTEVYGWEAAIRGARNPMNSWVKSDSVFSIENRVREGRFKTSVEIGENDLKLLKSLSKAGSDHGKFLRMINVSVDIIAPLYWWKEFDTYKVGTVANSCSTMHKLTEKEFELDDFSHDHLTPGTIDNVLKPLITILNASREAYLKFEEFNKEDPEGWDEGITCKKDIWWQMIQTLPSSYNQKRTVQLNYQVLKTMYFARKNHKLDEWHEFCAWCETLPYFKEICLDE
jgi:hypothetical protein